MASDKKKSSQKNSETEEVTSLSIAEQTEKFLASGGKIQVIPRGVSGQVNTSGPRHITLGKRSSDG